MKYILLDLFFYEGLNFESLKKKNVHDLECVVRSFKIIKCLQYNTILKISPISGNL